MNGRKVRKGEPTDANGQLPDDEVERREIFLSTLYTDARDTFKQLFTLNSAVIIFYATYAKDKIIKPNECGSVNGWDVATYIAFSLSMILCVVGYYMLQMASEKATNLQLWDFRLSLGRYHEYWGFALVANWCLEAAGFAFLIGVLLIGKILLH